METNLAESCTDPRKRSFVLRDGRVPFLFHSSAVSYRGTKMGQSFFRDVEMLVFGPTEISLCLANGFLAGSVRMRFTRALHWHAKTDDRLDPDQFGFVFYPLCRANSVLDSLEIVAVGNLKHMPTRRLEPFGSVLGERKVGRTIDGDLVVVV